MFAYIQHNRVVEISSFGGHNLPGIKVDLGENPEEIVSGNWYYEGVFYKTEDMPEIIRVTYPRRPLNKFSFISLFTEKEITAASKLRNSTLAQWWLKYDSASEFIFSDASLLDPLVKNKVISSQRKVGIEKAWPLV